MITIKETDDAVIAQVQSRVVDAKTAALLRESLLELMPRHRRYVLDLQQAQLVDSGGLAGLVMLLKSMNANQCEFVLCNLNKPVVALFQLTRMDRLFKTAADQAGALALLGATGQA